jgi:hypothetical protein
VNVVPSCSTARRIAETSLRSSRRAIVLSAICYTP